LRQAYDYWQNQPGNYLNAKLDTRRLPSQPNSPKRVEVVKLEGPEPRLPANLSGSSFN